MPENQKSVDFIAILSPYIPREVTLSTTDDLNNGETQVHEQELCSIPTSPTKVG